MLTNAVTHAMAAANSPRLRAPANALSYGQVNTPD